MTILMILVVERYLVHAVGLLSVGDWSATVSQWFSVVCYQSFMVRDLPYDGFQYTSPDTGVRLVHDHWSPTSRPPVGDNWYKL